MASEPEDQLELIENVSEIMLDLANELKKLYSYRDLFFENHPVEMASQKNKCVNEKKDLLVAKFESYNVDVQIPFAVRAEFLYMKGKCYNISSTYDSRAMQCLSKAVKLNPHLVNAWNELGECYLKNMNLQEAKASFEGALKHERNRLALRSLAIILRQESGQLKQSEISSAMFKSVELAKEAVAQDIKDGVSWSVLGNSYLCQYFMVAQDPATLKLCMSAYKQAWADPVAKGQPDLHYNKGVALKYSECYGEAIKMFDQSCRLDPGWQPPVDERAELIHYLTEATRLVRTRGKLKAKRISNMVQTIDKKMLGEYATDLYNSGTRKDVQLVHVGLDELQEGSNEGKVILARVLGSIHNKNAVPFTFAVIDKSLKCVCVSVYNWANGRGVIIGDVVAVPEPVLTTHAMDSDLAKFDFMSIRVNNPLVLLVNGKRVNRNQFARTRVTSTYEIH
ncbi:tetratricopeptide repeat protein 5-like [Pararge aegeria]|uniref:Cell division cycle protein 27 homolog n=1 Tax=Pararge aegeria aegeria TaxID=348720 RepID=A0A8S4RRX0_9NEOP|nr:tetratricopeptide repeat protein 5-like [Pararge aegeria]CAH2240370.1 jg17365 [Pararge aegeria aegeria]